MQTIEKLLKKADNFFEIQFYRESNIVIDNRVHMVFCYRKAPELYGCRMMYDTDIFLDDKGLEAAMQGNWDALPAGLPIGNISAYENEADVFLLPENLEPEYRKRLQEEYHDFLLKDLNGAYHHTLGGLLKFLCQEWLP